MDLVDAVYNQCHEHLRDADKKRDELIGFYAVVVGLLFAAYDKLDDPVRTLLATIIALVGVFVVLAVIQYRKWHTVYSNCFRVLQDAARQDPVVTRPCLEAAWKRLNISTSFLGQARLWSPFGGTEAPTFGALLVLSYVPWYLLPKLVPPLVLVTVPNDFVGFFAGFVVYWLLATLLGMFILQRTAKMNPFDHWILHPFALDPPRAAGAPGSNTSAV